ncbi:MAG TPA: cytochrome c oxidase subunit II [Chloroflexota bacterium]|nr:cytochrome c oxidase subunit II [Chloroflexota bacterium]
MSFDALRGRKVDRHSAALHADSSGAGRRAPVVRNVLLFLTLVVALAGCTTNNPQTTLEPRGLNALYIYDLFVWWMFWPAVLVFVVVEALLIYAIWRYRARPGGPAPAQFHGNTRLEITWTIVPALILVVILYGTFRTQAVLAQPPPSQNALNVRVIGHQWWWEFEYTDLGVSTANELHVPVGVPVVLQLESADVIHSFWVPMLGGKKDNIPGRQNNWWIQADNPGVYSAQCAEFCGVQHALMRFLVVAESGNEFDAWVRGQRSIPLLAPGGTGAQGASLVTQGAQLFASGACITCHTVRGTPAQGKVGPDLTHFGSRKSIAANTLPNTPENLAIWLKNPQAVKPGNLMPNLNLTDEQIAALVAYLESLK